MSSSNTPRAADFHNPSSGIRPDFSSAAFANVVAAAACDLGCTRDEVVAELNSTWDLEHARASEAHSGVLSLSRSALLSKPPSFVASMDEIDPQMGRLSIQDQPSPQSAGMNRFSHLDRNISYPKTYRELTQWYGWRVTDDDLVRWAQPLYHSDLLAKSGYERACIALKLIFRDLPIHRLRLELGYTPNEATGRPSPPYMVLTFAGYNMHDMEADVKFWPSDRMIEPINAWRGCEPQWFLAY